MLQERQGCSTRDRAGLYLLTSPVSGGAVLYDKPYYTTHPPYNCELAESLILKEVVSESYDFASMLNASQASRPDSMAVQRFYRGTLYQDPDSFHNYLSRISDGKGALTNAFLLFSGRWGSFGHVANASIKGENPCVHNNLFGSVSSDGRWGLIRKYEESDPQPLTSVSQLSLDPIVLAADAPSTNVPSGMLIDQVLDGQHDWTNGVHTCSYPFVITRGDEFGKFVLVYHYGIQYDDAGLNRRTINWFAVRFTFDFEPAPGNYGIGESVPLNALLGGTILVEWTPGTFAWCSPINANPSIYNLEYIYNYQGGKLNGFDPFDDWSGLEYYHAEVCSAESSLATVINRSSISHHIGYDLVDSRFISSGDDTFLRFCHRSDRIVKEALSCVSLSYSEAMDTQFGKLSANYLETLSELGDVLAPLDVAELARVLPRYIGKKGVLVVKILDLLTSAYLTYKFGIAPTLSDAEEVAGKAESLKDKIIRGNAFREQKSHGKTVIEIEEGNDFGVPPCVVILQSTLRLRMEPDALLTALVTVDSVGLLPSLSNVWDIVPFSFLVDWFYPVGSALEIVDNQAKILMFDCLCCVHTINVVQNIQDDVLRDLGYSSTEYKDGELRRVGYNKFVRFVTDKPPVFGPTRLPVIVAPGIPDFGLAGSLAWKILS